MRSRRRLHLRTAAPALTAAAVLLSIELAAAQLANTPWPVSQHDVRHTGQSHLVGPLFPSGTPAPENVKRWKGFDKIKMSPVLGADGTVYVGLGFSFCAIKDMATKWCTRLRADVSGSAAAVQAPNTTYKGIVYAGTIYVGDRDNTLTAFDPDGNILWRYNNGYEGDIWTSPAIGINGTIYYAHTQTFQGFGVFTALNPDGTLKWNNVIGTPVTSSPAIDPSGFIYLPASNGVLHKFQDNGTFTTHLWQTAVGGGPSHPVIGPGGSVIYVGTRSGLTAVNSDGQVLWTFATVGSAGAPVLANDGTLYVGSKSAKMKRFYAVNPNGTLKWSYGPVQIEADVNPLPIIGADGVVYVAIGASVHAFSPQGTILWTYTTANQIISFPVIGVAGDGRAILYVGSSDWTLYQISGSRSVPFSGQADDFNGDDKADLLWRHTSGALAMWLMNWPSANSTASLGTVGTDWIIAGLGDFNGDGKADILWRHTSGAVFMWLMNGPSASSPAPLGTVGTDWIIAGLGDFNGDGKADILWRHTSGAVFMWLMNGPSASSPAPLGTVGTDWIIAGLGDFNGDGKADILWRHTSGAVFVWLMNGPSASSPASLGTVGTDWIIAGVADFNGDGKADLLWRHTSGALAMWLMNGPSASSPASLGTVGTAWTVADVADFNGDGKADILWRHSSGAVFMWLMNGPSVSSTASLGTVRVDWDTQ